MVSDLIESRNQNDFPTHVLFHSVRELEKTYSELPIVREMLNFSDDVEVRTFFYEVCDDFISCPGSETDISITLRDIYEEQRERMNNARLFVDNKHPLVTGELLEVIPASFFAEANIKLTEKGKKTFLGDDYDILARKSTKNSDMIAAEDIKYKALFYDEKLTSQIDFIGKSLQGDQLKKLQKRLEDKALPKGIAALFYGALFGKRKDVASSNSAQVENTIQNIILEELESLEGILIATTNLVSNLDSAFARRFLFKIKFNQPSTEAKKAIWKTKLEWLSDIDAERLANNYDLSVGEIDNVARKCSIEEILNGDRPSIDTLAEWCREEKLSDDKNSAIGF